MKALAALLVACFGWSKWLGDSSIPAILGSSGTLPPWLQIPSYTGNVLATLFCFDALFLGLALLTFWSLARLLSDNAVGLEWAWILGGASILHAAVGKHLSIVTVGPVASIASALAFELVFRWRLSSLRYARSTLLSGGAALFLSPTPIFLGATCGVLVGAAISVMLARERKLVALSLVKTPYLTALPPPTKRRTLDDFIASIGRKAS